MNSNIMYFIL